MFGKIRSQTAKYARMKKRKKNNKTKKKFVYKFVLFRPMYCSINAKWLSQAKHQQIILNWFVEKEGEKKHTQGGNYFVFNSFFLLSVHFSLL